MTRNRVKHVIGVDGAVRTGCDIAGGAGGSGGGSELGVSAGDES